MPPSSKAPRNDPDFDKPDTLPIEVRAHATEIKKMRKIIGDYMYLFEDLPSFEPLNQWFERLLSYFEETIEWIKKYLVREINLRSFDHEMLYFSAEELELLLEDLPGSSRAGKSASLLESQLFADVEDVMQFVWELVREQGYKLHVALIRG